MAAYSADQLHGKSVKDNEGGKIGKIEGVYTDEHNGEPEWVAVSTGMFGSKESLIPVAGASFDGEALTVPFDKTKVKGAPHQDPDTELSQAAEAELFTYYGVPYGGETVTATGAPQGAPVTTPSTTDGSMTLSEEQVKVGTRQVETGRVRLRKYIVTEQVTQTVPVSHEEVRIEREPLTGTEAGIIGEDVQEIVLHGEEPVVSKTAVATERISLGTDTVTEQARVDETVRKEQFETDGVVTEPSRI